MCAARAAAAFDDAGPKSRPLQGAPQRSGHVPIGDGGQRLGRQVHAVVMGDQERASQGCQLRRKKGVVDCHARSLGWRG